MASINAGVHQQVLQLLHQQAPTGTDNLQVTALGSCTSNGGPELQIPCPQPPEAFSRRCELRPRGISQFTHITHLGLPFLSGSLPLQQIQLITSW